MDASRVSCALTTLWQDSTAGRAHPEPPDPLPVCEVPTPAEGEALRAQSGRGAHTDQVPSPRLRTTLGSYKHYICIALKKQSHVM